MTHDFSSHQGNCDSNCFLLCVSTEICWTGIPSPNQTQVSSGASLFVTQSWWTSLCFCHCMIVYWCGKRSWVFFSLVFWDSQWWEQKQSNKSSNLNTHIHVVYPCLRIQHIVDFIDRAPLWHHTPWPLLHQNGRKTFFILNGQKSCTTTVQTFGWV